MTEGRLYFLNKPDPSRPIEEKYIAEINNLRKSFINQEDALLYLYDNGVKTYKSLTKEALEYKDIKKLPTFEFWHIENRVGYVLHTYKPSVNENAENKRKKSFVWRFIGFGKSCFSDTKEELATEVQSLIAHYKKDPENRGFNTYPFYTRHYRVQGDLS